MRHVACILFILAIPAAHAEPWLCKMPDGTKQFSYEPESATARNCVHHPIPNPRGHVRATPSREMDHAGSGTFPRVDGKTQKGRDIARREILERELTEERRALAEAIKELAELKQAGLGAKAPAALRQYEERIRTHRTNIATIEKELALAG